jgi:uncharacterized protein YycO
LELSTKSDYQCYNHLSIVSLIFAVRLIKTQKQNPSYYIKTLNYSQFRSGDLIFRKGNGLLGQALLKADSASQFSHVGIIKIIQQQIFVIHGSTGKPLGTNAFVKIESLESFLQSELASAVAIYRLKNNDQDSTITAVNFAYQAVLDQVPFDVNFDLENADQFYCTELVWRAYLASGIDLVEGNFSSLDLPLAQNWYILPKNLLESPHLQQVYYYNIEESIQP